jgi:hypothetical protein
VQHDAAQLVLALVQRDALEQLAQCNETLGQELEQNNETRDALPVQNNDFRYAMALNYEMGQNMKNVKLKLRDEKLELKNVA